MVIQFVNIIKVIFYIILIMKKSYIDLTKRFNLQQKKVEDHELKDKIENYYKEKKFRKTIYNIDSEYRNKIPKNILDKEIKKLPNSPLTFFNNSSEMKIFVGKHSYKEKDRIILENVKNTKLTVMNSIIFINNFNHVLIKMKFHGAKNKSQILISELKSNINPTFDNTNEIKKFGNIPSNSLFGPKSIILIDNFPEIHNTLVTNLEKDINEIKLDYFLIKLPFNYISDNNLVIDNPTILCSLELLEIAGIPLSFINANYPINYERFIGFHEISRISEDHIYINLKVKANKTANGGRDGIKLSKILKIIRGYEDSNEYTINLKKNFNNVVKLELISTEFNRIEKIIFSSGKNKNNKLYWKHLEDSNRLYEITIDEGDYTTNDLINEISEKMNQTIRYIDNYNNKIYNIFDFNINKDTDITTFTSYNKIFLPNSLSVSLETIDTGIISNVNKEKYIVTVQHDSNYLVEGDEITINGSDNIGKIPNNVINKKHQIYKIDNDKFTYSFILDDFIPLDEDNINGNGGINIEIKHKAMVSFLFDRNDTVGSILGFKNIGKSNSITPFNNITTNQDDYIFPNIYNNVGILDTNNNIINLKNKNLYFLMHLNNYESIISNTPEGSCFAKIQILDEENMFFNTFVPNPVEFEKPIINLNQLDIKFTYPDGTKPNFNNLNHSFTLLIVEEINKNIYTGKNSNDSTFIDSVINNEISI